MKAGSGIGTVPGTVQYVMRNALDGMSVGKPRLCANENSPTKPRADERGRKTRVAE